MITIGQNAPASLRVSAASVTGTHPLDLARQLAARSVLSAYYTALPHSRTPGLPPSLVHRHLLLTPLLHIAMRGWFPRRQDDIFRFVELEFDRWVSGRLRDTDIVHALAGIAGRRRAAARKIGALNVCDAPTSHIRFRRDLLDAEHRKWGVPPLDEPEAYVAAVERDYDESDLILAPSRFVYDSFLSRGVPESKLALTPYGVDLDEYKPMPRQDDVFRILFVGTLCVRKGLPYLLDAVGALRFENAELALRGGRTPETARILSSYKGSIPLRMVPAQPRARLKDLYSAASVTVLPSIEDGFGLVIGQSLACATPVIASTNTGGPDVIEEGVNGFIVPPGDTAALRRTLTAAYEDREHLRRMGTEGRRRVEAARGWGGYGDRVTTAFSLALGRPTRAGARQRCSQ